MPGLTKKETGSLLYPKVVVAQIQALQVTVMDEELDEAWPTRGRKHVVSQAQMSHLGRSEAAS